MKQSYNLWRRNVTCQVIKQRMLQPSSCHITAAPLREFRMETECWSWSSQLLQPPLWCTLRRLRMRKHRILAPDSWGACQRNDFNEPRLASCYTQKSADFITLRCLVFFNEHNLLMFWLPSPCCTNPFVSCLAPATPLLFTVAPQSDPSVLSPGLEVLKESAK